MVCFCGNVFVLSVCVRLPFVSSFVSNLDDWLILAVLARCATVNAPSAFAGEASMARADRQNERGTHGKDPKIQDGTGDDTKQASFFVYVHRTHTQAGRCTTTAEHNKPTVDSSQL